MCNTFVAQAMSYLEDQNKHKAAAAAAPSSQKNDKSDAFDSSSLVGAEPVSDGVIVGRAYNPTTFIALPVRIISACTLLILVLTHVHMYLYLFALVCQSYTTQFVFVFFKFPESSIFNLSSSSLVFVISKL